MKKMYGVVAIIALNLVAAQAFAFSIEAGDKVTADVGYPIGLESSDNVAYDAFCLEKGVSIYNGTYTVASVSDRVERQNDPISDFSKWVYAAYVEGDLPAVTYENGFNSYAYNFSMHHPNLGRIAQEVIWYEENETAYNPTSADAASVYGVYSIYYNLKNNYYGTDKGHDWAYYADMGWDVNVINFANANGACVQTLIVGEKEIDPVTPSEVPEPATMALFGLGLLGFSGVMRKRK